MFFPWVYPYAARRQKCKNTGNKKTEQTRQEHVDKILISTFMVFPTPQTLQLFAPYGLPNAQSEEHSPARVNSEARHQARPISAISLLLQQPTRHTFWETNQTAAAKSAPSMQCAFLSRITRRGDMSVSPCSPKFIGNVSKKSCT